MSKLLIVDDEVDVREFAKSFFTKRDIDVTITGSGKEALGLIDEENPDLVLLDIHMEEMDGVDVLKQLRAKGDETKVIMVTGVEEEETIKEVKGLGIKGYIHKPLVLEELEEIVMAELN